MTDRELLELAAKAVGYERNSAGPVGPCEWNPLADDGDALRLAMAIGMDSIEIVVDEWPDHASGIMRKEPNIPATRRAIVRAAAQIGGQKKSTT